MLRSSASFLLAGVCFLAFYGGSAVQAAGNALPPPLWSVQEVSLPAGVVPGESRPSCVAIRTLPGGDELRLSGGGEKLNGVSLRSSVFILPPQGMVPVVLDFDGAGKRLSFSGYAVDSHSVVVDVSKQDDLYAAARRSHFLNATVGEGTSAPRISFSLMGMEATLHDLEACYLGRPYPGSVASAPDPSASTLEDMSVRFDDGDSPIPPVPSETLSKPNPVRAELSPPPLPAKAVLPAEASAREKVVVVAQDSVPKESVSGLSSSDPSSGSLKMPPPNPLVPAFAGLTIPRSVPPAPAVPVSAPVREIAPAPAPPPARSVVNESFVVAPAHESNEPIVESFRARTGESLRDVVRRWADRSGMDLVWTSKDDVILKDNFSFVGTFDKALNKLLAAYPESGLTPIVQAGDDRFSAQPFNAPVLNTPPGDLAAFVPPPEEAVAVPAPEAESPVLPSAPVGPVQRWRALQGASLREVLQAWSEDAGVLFVWSAPHDYAVQNSVTLNTDYAQAVTRLLDQYRPVSPRPVGQIYAGQAEGEKVLVIRPASSFGAAGGN